MGNMAETLSDYSSTWLIGSRVLDDFYIVYDMEEGDGETYRLGIGPKNPKDQIGQDITDTTSRLSQYIDILIGATVISFVCLLIVCICFCRRKNKNDRDILDTTVMTEVENERDQNQFGGGMD